MEAVENAQLKVPEIVNSFPFDAIVVLGAFMQKDAKTGEWKMPTVIEEDPGKVVGGHSRAIAVQQLFKEQQAQLFVVTGGMQNDAPNPDVSRAEVLADLIKNKYHVPENQVKAITTVGNTLGNIDSIVMFLQQNSEVLINKKIGILSNRWQLERSKLMFDDVDFFKSSGINLEFMASEDVLKRRSKHYDKWENSLESSDAMNQRKVMEKKGINAYKGGIYKPLSK